MEAVSLSPQERIYMNSKNAHNTIITHALLITYAKLKVPYTLEMYHHTSIMGNV